MTPSGPAIVSIAQNVPGPVAVARLVSAGFGAHKIEPPSGDPLAEMSPSWYAALHKGVAVERVDLKSRDGAARLHAVLETAEVFLSSHRPGSLARLGLDGTSLRDRHPHLHVVNIVGDTTDADVAGHDLTYQARAGLVGPAIPATLLADLMGAERVVTTILIALRGRPAAHVVGLADSLRSLTAPITHGLTGKGQLLGGGLPAYGVYRAREGRVAVAALEPHFRRRLYEALGLPVDAPLHEVFAHRTAGEWEAWAHERDIPLVKVAD